MSSKQRHQTLWLLVAFYAMLSLAASANAILGDKLKWEATSFCKCVCFGSNYTILHLEIPDNPSKPCLSCNKQWCINQNLPICAGASLGDTDPDTATGKEGDVEARCFQRDSPRDQLVVTLFLLTVFGLLLGAGIKGRMVKAGLDPNVPWNTGRKWWQALVPQLESIGIGTREARRPGRMHADGLPRGEYIDLPTREGSPTAA